MDTKQLRVASEVWFGAASLQYESYKKNKNQEFTAKEIIQRIFEVFKKIDPNWVLRPGIMVHVNLHCVANKPPNPNTLCYLYKTESGGIRLFKKGDKPHDWRQNGKTKPDLLDIPTHYPQEFKDEFKKLLAWYNKEYNK